MESESKRNGEGSIAPNSNPPAIDPTRNVLDLVDAAVARLNDLQKVEIRRLDDLATAESRRVDEQLVLRAQFDKDLREAEAKRIDAIRAVDVNAVAVASERANQQATVLANQVTASADTLRTLVTTSATTVANQLTQIITPITDRLALLEKAQYEGSGKQSQTDPKMEMMFAELKTMREAQFQNVGKQTVADPILVEALAELKAMREKSFTTQGTDTGQKNMIGWIIAGVLFLISVVSFVFMLVGKQ